MNVPSTRIIASRTKWLWFRFITLCSSIALTLCILEGSLRLFYPKYQYAADSDHKNSETRIWSRNANSSYLRMHPDTGATHWVIHNNLALRQHRDFDAKALERSTTLAFFGDSFTENLRIPSAYSFTEPLDYLLNLGGNPFITLNYGIDGYGTDQAYLYYQEAVRHTRLDHVFYVFSANDIRNIFENELFALEGKRLVNKPPPKSSLWVRLTANFHLTYLIVESIDRLFFSSVDLNKRIDLGAFLKHSRNYHSPEADAIETALRSDPDNEKLQTSLALFCEIIRKWKHDVEKNGSHFHIIILPRRIENIAFALSELKDINTINLYESFSTNVDERNFRQLFFKNDAHWNEQGNAWAARNLYEHLKSDRIFEPVNEFDINQSLYDYYSAFSRPDALPNWIEASQSILPSMPIFQKYNALEISIDD